MYVNYEHLMQQLYEQFSNDNEVRLKNIEPLYVIHDSVRTVLGSTLIDCTMA